MRNLILSLILFSAVNIYSQEKKPSRNEIKMETDTGKVFQGAIVASFTYFTVQQFMFEHENEWIKVPISILSAYLFETALNINTTERKQAFVVGGAVLVNFKFEIFKSKRRSLIR